MIVSHNDVILDFSYEKTEWQFNKCLVILTKTELLYKRYTQLQDPQRFSKIKRN